MTDTPEPNPETSPETRLIQRLVDEVAALLPEGWETATLTYWAVGDYEAVSLGGTEREHRGYPAGIRAAGRRIPGTRVPGLLRRHREMTSDPERTVGAWPELTYKLWNKDGAAEWSVSASDLDKFPRVDELAPADCVIELRRFPRSAENIPEWMRALVDLHQAAEAYTGAPQRESELVALLPPGTERLFARAREKLVDFVPGAGTLHAGTPREGAWTVAHSGGAWLAVGPGGDVHPYAEPQRAAAHAMAGIMAAAGMEINSTVLRAARILRLQRYPAKGEQAWLLDDDGRKLSRLTDCSPRPDGPGAYISLDPLHNRPDEYFVCVPGPAPEEGSYVSVHKVYMKFAEKVLPVPAPQPEAVPEPPSEVLEPGMEVDAYGDPVNCFVYTVGTPFLRRGLWGSPDDHDYHRYRVAKPIRAYTGLFAPGPLGGDPPPPDTGMGFYLVDSIADFVASGHLVEIPGDRPRD
ncbi:glycohydrolase toxin TNT-related protein [Actinomadura welshii]